MPRKLKTQATFDASFWVHAVALDLVASLCVDYRLAVTEDVVSEVGSTSRTGQCLERLLASRQLARKEPSTQRVALFGIGERAAINLALEENCLLLIDDWRPAEAARALGISTLTSILYLVQLYSRGRRKDAEVLRGFAMLARRNSIRPEYLLAALRLVAEVRRRRRK